MQVKTDRFYNYVQSEEMKCIEQQWNNCNNQVFNTLLYNDESNPFVYINFVADPGFQ